MITYCILVTLYKSWYLALTTVQIISTNPSFQLKELNADNLLAICFISYSLPLTASPPSSFISLFVLLSFVSCVIHFSVSASISPQDFLRELTWSETWFLAQAIFETPCSKSLDFNYGKMSIFSSQLDIKGGMLAIFH